MIRLGPDRFQSVNEQSDRIALAAFRHAHDGDRQSVQVLSGPRFRRESLSGLIEAFAQNNQILGAENGALRFWARC
jgi:hypothetical protein